MQQPMGLRRRILIGMVAIIALGGGTFSGWRVAGAQYFAVFEDAPYEEQVGVEEVIERLYQGAPSINIHANIARFDNAEHAAQGLQSLNAWFLIAYNTVSDTTDVEPVEDATSVAGARAHVALLDIGADADPHGEVALIQAQDDVYVYTVAVKIEYGSAALDDAALEELKGVSLEAAVAMIEAIATTPAGEATPSAGFGEPATSGMWAKLPAQEHEVPQRYGVTSTEDTVYLAPAPLSESMMALYGSGEGLETVVGRNYALEDEITGYIEIAAFDDPANTEAAFPNVGPAQLTALGLDGAELEETSADVSADAVVAYGAQVENEGEQIAVSVIIARSGPYIVTVAVVANASQEVPAFAAELTRTVIDDEAGAGEPRYIDWGMSSGGVWDKLPLTGDDILRGMSVTGDLQLHPEEEDGF
jgi:hypothetical protein